MKARQENALHLEVMGTLERLKRKHPDLEKELERAHGYAVFPSIGRASLVLGGSHGNGQVFEKGKPVGFAAITQITIGVQVGGQMLSEIIFFNDRKSLEAFKGGKAAFAANASATIVKASASGTTNYAKCTAHAYGRGGMLLEASLGGQKFTFIPPSEAKEKGGEEMGGRAAQKRERKEGGGAEGMPFLEGIRSRLQSPQHPMTLTSGILGAAALLGRIAKVQASLRSDEPAEA